MRRVVLLTLVLGLPACRGDSARASSPGAPEGAPSLSTASSAAPVAPTGAPIAAKRPEIDAYHGVSVSDDYQWLEGDGEEVKAWSNGQSEVARRFLDGLPNRASIGEQVRKLMTARSTDWHGLRFKNGRLFAIEDRPETQQPTLVVIDDFEPSKARVIVDPNRLDARGATSLDWYAPTEDGKLVAVSLSEGGSESGTVHVFDVASGNELARDRVPRAQGGTAGGSLAWNHEGTGFWYTRYPHPGERPAADLDFYQQVYFHRLGSDAKDDTPSLVDDLPRVAEIELETSPDGRHVLANVANGDGGEFSHFLLDARSPRSAWKKFADLKDEVVDAQFGVDGGLWLRSTRDAPKGRIFRLDPKKPELSRAELILAEGSAVIDSFQVTKTKLFTAELLGGPYQVRMFDHAGKARAVLPILPVSSVGRIVRLEGDDVLVRNESYVAPPAWYHWQAASSRLIKTALAQVPAASFDDAEVVREVCRSEDGTEVPVSILLGKGTRLDGANPFVLYGYGGYGISLSPRFQALLRLWLDRGGIYAVANVRGGGEFGEAWHRAGNLTQKQHVFDDFIACEKHVIERGYTRPDKLAISGASNGGLLVGAAATQAPELVRAVVARVGIFDMLRVELSPNGAFNVTEFGTVANEAEFRALYAYSPYHRVRDGVRYPAFLFMTGANDPRVDPFHSRKMVARLQAANASQHPILLRTSANTGHGGGTPLDARIAENTDLWSFLAGELGAQLPTEAD